MNQLQHETSPYLLQHAHNPVNWCAWKPEAFEVARRENKPILVSIGYSTCHWCHVMERESFENEDIAAIMNNYFVNIKVDREERPDVDHIYMEACQALTGAGGWPLNCFLLPDGRPFFAGTYYPPMPAHNRPSWGQLLQHINKVYKERYADVVNQAERLTEMIEHSDATFYDPDSPLGLTPQNDFPKEVHHNIYEHLKKSFDTEDGGFGNAPKFPGTMSLDYLLQYYFHTQHSAALKHVQFSLEKMIRGGIYDQLGGGFARYTVDKSWLVPHFEKMLYDNAQLISLLSDLYKATDEPLYKLTITETLKFISREMTSSEGGFFSALDADSEGEEGKFYVWQEEEIDQILEGEMAEIFKQYYGVSKAGNWEGKNILWRPRSLSAVAIQFNYSSENLQKILEEAKKILFKHRSGRIRPSLDDKIILNWNALQLKAYAKAYKALKETKYKEAAIRNYQFIKKNLLKEDGIHLYHTYKNGKAQYDSFLDDYSYFTDALLELYSITFDEKYLHEARAYADLVIDDFYDKNSGLFFYTSEEQNDIPVRKREVYDTSIPSGNSTMAAVLMTLATVTGQNNYKDIAARAMGKLCQAVEKYPTSFSNWAAAMLKLSFPNYELAILGENAKEKAEKINTEYLPNIILMSSATSNDDFPVLKGRAAQDDALIYVCREYACQLPVEEVSAAIRQIVG